MKTLVATTLMLFLSLPAFTQEHAPLPAQCVADANLWSHVNKEALDKLSFTELGARASEMSLCANSGAPDPQISGNSLIDNYATLWSAYQLKQGQRVMTYLVRHGLKEQFLAEDAAGKR